MYKRQFLTRSVRDTARMLDACEGADLGAPYYAPPLTHGHAAAISRPPRRLRVALCDTTFTGDAIDPEVAEAVRATGRLLESLGHHVEPGYPASADVPMMMRAWTDIVGIGSALSVQSALKGRDLTRDDVEGVTRGAIAHSATLPATRYLQAVGEIHDFGRQMARYFDTGPDIPVSYTHLDVYKRQARTVPGRTFPAEGSGLRGGGFPVAQRLAPVCQQTLWPELCDL